MERVISTTHQSTSLSGLRKQKTHDSPIHDEHEQRRTEKEERDRDDRVGDDEGQGRVEAISGLLSKVGALFNDCNADPM